MWVTVSTSNPDSVFVTQQARNLAMSLSDEGAAVRFLIHDRDARFSSSFDDIFANEGIPVICTPITSSRGAEATGRSTWSRSTRPCRTELRLPPARNGSGTSLPASHQQAHIPDSQREKLLGCIVYIRSAKKCKLIQLLRDVQQLVVLLHTVSPRRRPCRPETHPCRKVPSRRSQGRPTPTTVLTGGRIAPALR